MPSAAAAVRLAPDTKNGVIGCALLRSGDAWCWGEEQFGSTGATLYADSTSAHRPTAEGALALQRDAARARWEHGPRAHHRRHVYEWTGDEGFAAIGITNGTPQMFDGTPLTKLAFVSTP